LPAFQYRPYTGPAGLCPFSLTFQRDTSKIQEVVLLTLLLVFAVVLGFVSGSIWLFTAAVGALMVKMFPILLVLLALGAAAFLIFKHYYRK
jgi:hypothetical protein